MSEHKDLMDLINRLSQEEYEKLLINLLTNIKRQLDNNRLNELLTANRNDR